MSYCRGSRNCSGGYHRSLEGSLLPEFDPSCILRRPQKGVTSAAELQRRAGLPAVCATLSRAELQQAQLIAQVCPAAAHRSLTCCRLHCCASACPLLIHQCEAKKCGRHALQVDSKFLAVVSGGKLALVDQHAADERVQLERLRGQVLADGGNQVGLKVAGSCGP